MGGWFSRADDVDLLVAKRLPKDIYRLILAYAAEFHKFRSFDFEACAMGVLDENTIVVTRHEVTCNEGLHHIIERLDLVKNTKVWSHIFEHEALCKLIVLENGHVVVSRQNGLTMWNREGAHITRFDMQWGFDDICAMQGSKIVVKFLTNHIVVLNASFEYEWDADFISGWSQALATLGESVITGHSNGHVAIWGPQTNGQDFFVHDGAVTSLCATKNLVFAGFDSGHVFACDLQGAILRVFEGCTTRVSDLVCFGKTIAAASYEMVYVWDVDSGRCQTLDNSGICVTALAAHNGKLIVGSEQFICVWE